MGLPEHSCEEVHRFTDMFAQCLCFATTERRSSNPWNSTRPYISCTSSSALTLSRRARCPSSISTTPPIFTEYDAYDASAATLTTPLLSDGVAVINIACLMETPSMLPFAWYLLGDLMMDRYVRVDGSKERLDVDDLRLYIDGRALLA